MQRIKAFYVKITNIGHIVADKNVCNLSIFSSNPDNLKQSNEKR